MSTVQQIPVRTWYPVEKLYYYTSIAVGRTGIAMATPIVTMVRRKPIQPNFYTNSTGMKMALHILTKLRRATKYNIDDNSLLQARSLNQSWNRVHFSEPETDPNPMCI